MKLTVKKILCLTVIAASTNTWAQDISRGAQAVAPVESTTAATPATPKVDPQEKFSLDFLKQVRTAIESELSTCPDQKTSDETLPSIIEAEEKMTANVSVMRGLDQQQFEQLAQVYYAIELLTYCGNLRAMYGTTTATTVSYFKSDALQIFEQSKVDAQARRRRFYNFYSSSMLGALRALQNPGTETPVAEIRGQLAEYFPSRLIEEVANHIDGLSSMIGFVRETGEAPKTFEAITWAFVYPYLAEKVSNNLLNNEISFDKAYIEFLTTPPAPSAEEAAPPAQ